MSEDILVIGRSGQVATALLKAEWPEGVKVSAYGRDVVDLRRPEEIEGIVAGGDWAAVVNAAAYTYVDRAESEPQLAFSLNRDGPEALAQACRKAGCPLIHLSTDYVFDGSKSGPYNEDDPANPISVYGASKAEGEAAIRTDLTEHVILRTSWVFGATGQNFVKTMLQLARDRTELRIVNDQHGCPTAAQDIAQAIVQIVVALLNGKPDGYGTFHFTNLGVTTWYRFACEIFRQAELRGFAFRPRLIPVSSVERGQAARRPLNSVLDMTRIERVYGIRARPWERALPETLDALLVKVTASLEGAGAPRSR
jgi:dTDP-4-dehydrorhamnose reductase